MNKTLFYCFAVLLAVTVGLFSLSGRLLTAVGDFLVIDQKPFHSDAVVVLNTGVEYYPRLIEAAFLYNRGIVKQIVINGNRKTEALRALEDKGLRHCCPWYEERVRILELYKVPRKDIITISAEDVYDTVSEAKTVGAALIAKRMNRIVITTSKSHTRRASYIWEKAWTGKLEISTVAAKADGFMAAAWWKDRRQVRLVLAEYGAWCYYFWKRLKIP